MYLLQNFPVQNHFCHALGCETPGTWLCARAAADPQLWPRNPQTSPAGPRSVSPGGGAAFHLGGNAGWCFGVWNSLTLPAAHLGWGPYQGDNFEWLNHHDVMQWNTGSLSRKQTVRPLLRVLQTFSGITLTIQRLHGGHANWKSGIPFFALYKTHSCLHSKSVTPRRSSGLTICVCKQWSLKLNIRITWRTFCWNTACQVSPQSCWFCRYGRGPKFCISTSTQMLLLPLAQDHTLTMTGL